MVEALAVASGKGGTGKTTNTLALGMALATDYDVTVIDADTGMANLLFHAGLDDVETTLHDVLIEGGASVHEATYDRFGMRVVPCGTSLAAFEVADPDRLRAGIADLASDTDLLLDSPAALGSKSAILPVVLADRVVVVFQPTIPALSDGLKIQEYATSYGAGTAAVVLQPRARARTHRAHRGPRGRVPRGADARRRARERRRPCVPRRRAGR
jgi:septum site-determining protein MinD